MINHNYWIDTNNIAVDNSGAQCDYLPIKNRPELGFKSFKHKNKAQIAYSIQRKLSKLELAPKLYSGLCKIAYYYHPDILQFWTPKETITGWGFITERAFLIPIGDHVKIPYRKIQKLVNTIKFKTNMKFWDCHEDNVGYIKRGRRSRLVCIDTGKESFEAYSNAWGYEEPGPKCPYCLKYQCKCIGD